eukprot:950639-Amphidinium_carterae.1
MEWHWEEKQAALHRHQASGFTRLLHTDLPTQWLARTPFHTFYGFLTALGWTSAGRVSSNEHGKRFMLRRANKKGCKHTSSYSLHK